MVALNETGPVGVVAVGGVARVRPQALKPCMTMEDSRRSRDETTVQLRKAKKHEQMMKRRCNGGTKPGSIVPTVSNSFSTDSEDSSSSITTNASFDSPSSELIKVYLKWQLDRTSVTQEELLNATKEFRKRLTKKPDEVVEIINLGLVYYLVQILATHSQNGDAPTLFEALWALTNIASTPHAKVVAENGAIPHLTYLIQFHDVPHVREQAAWTIGNLAGDSINLRDALLQTPGTVEGMIKNLNNPSDANLLSNVSWATSNLCRGKPLPPLEITQAFVLPLINVLQGCDQHNMSASVRSDAVWALSYISDGGDDHVAAVMQHEGAIGVLLKLLKDHMQDRSVIIPAVRTFGNFIAGNDEQTERVLKAGFLRYAMPLLQHESKHLRKDTCWLLSNIAAGTKNQVEQLFDIENEYGLVQKLVYIADNTNWEIRREAIHAVCNIITNGEDKHRMILANMGILNVFSRLLVNWDDSKILLVIIEAIDKMLETSQNCGLHYDRDLEETSGLDALEALQNHQNITVYEHVVKIIMKYFNDGEEEEDQNIAPTIHDDEFSFGLPAKQLFTDGSASSPTPMSFSFGGSNSYNVYGV